MVPSAEGCVIVPGHFPVSTNPVLVSKSLVLSGSTLHPLIATVLGEVCLVALELLNHSPGRPSGEKSVTR